MENLDVKLENEKAPHEFRIGFSTDDSGLQLGEKPTSFAYASNAKKANDSVFSDYGATFAKDDVVAAMLDFTDATNVKISFSKNGEDQGEAFSVAKTDLQGAALFPHVSSRNVKFEVNFGKAKDGADREAWFAAEGYTFVAQADEASRTRGMAR